MVSKSQIKGGGQRRLDSSRRARCRLLCMGTEPAASLKLRLIRFPGHQLVYFGKRLFAGGEEADLLFDADHLRH